MRTLIVLLLALSANAFAGTDRVLDGKYITNGPATLTIPSSTDTLIGRNTSDTLTNKTLTSPVINSPTGITKSDVGLSNVDNTSDANKPVSTAVSSALAGKVNTSAVGANNGVAGLDSGGKVPYSQLPSTLMSYLGTYNPNTNTPSLADGTGTNGDVYVVSAAGSHDFGSGSITFAAGDWVIYNGSVWQKSINSNAVSSVNSQTGAVTLTKSDVGLGNVLNLDQSNPANITQDSTHRFATDAEKSSWNAKQSALGFTPEDVANKSTSTSLGTSNTLYPTQNAVKSYVDTAVAGATASPTVSGSQASPVAVTAGGGVTFSGSNYFNTKYIEGSGGAVTITANPQIAAASSVGQRLRIICTSATNTVTFADGTGLSLNGPFVCGNNSAMELDWNGSVWTEVARR